MATDATNARRYRFIRHILTVAKAGGGIEVNQALQMHQKPEPGESIRLYYYPQTPVGFVQETGDDFDEVVDAMMADWGGADED